MPYPKESLSRDTQAMCAGSTARERSRLTLGLAAARAAREALPNYDRVRALDAEGICVSAGAACHSGSVEPSSTMKAMGKPLREAMGVVRFSLSRYTTAEEIDRTVAVISDVVQRANAAR
jgi:cysteine sulfinate desulfinase/cysteine desulfurase-like protein